MLGCVDRFTATKTKNAFDTRQFRRDRPDFFTRSLARGPDVCKCDAFSIQTCLQSINQRHR